MVFEKNDFLLRDEFFKATEKEAELDRPTQVVVLGGDFKTRYYFSYKSENVSFSDGITLAIQKEENGFSGAFATLNTKCFKYGRIDIVADIPVRKGIGVSFKLTSDTSAEYSTSLEFLSVNGKDHDSYAKFHTYFIDKCDNEQKHVVCLGKTAKATLLDGENTISFERTKEKIVMYLNNEEFRRLDLTHPLNAIFNQPAYLELDINAGSYTCDEIDNTDDFPISLKIKDIIFTQQEA